MKITLKWLKDHDACGEAIKCFKRQKEIDSTRILGLLIKQKQYGWANWFIVRIMEYRQYVAYAIYAAKQVIDIYEKKYPDDKRPREAIQAAKKCLKNPNAKNKTTAAYAAAAAAYAATAATNAATAAAYAATVAAYAATAATNAATAAAYAATAAAYAAAENKMKLKILKYGIKLLNKKAS